MSVQMSICSLSSVYEIQGENQPTFKMLLQCVLWLLWGWHTIHTACGGRKVNIKTFGLKTKLRDTGGPLLRRVDENVNTSRIHRRVELDSWMECYLRTILFRNTLLQPHPYTFHYMLRGSNNVASRMEVGNATTTTTEAQTYCIWCFFFRTGEVGSQKLNFLSWLNCRNFVVLKHTLLWLIAAASARRIRCET